jgi:hypothetical protein
MKQLEIIHLRSSGAPIETLGKQIAEAVRAEGGPTDAVTIFRRCGLETDIALHLHHHDVSGSGPSALALHLAAGLKALGLIEHTLWEELK